VISCLEHEKTLNKSQYGFSFDTTKQNPIGWLLEVGENISRKAFSSDSAKTVIVQ
jgi:hypothetical protein